MKEFEYPSCGAGRIHAYCWEPEGKPVAVVQLVHGIAEHMLRYDDFARYLNQQGALVVAEDHMGHGKSTGSGARLYFAGGWRAAVDDTYALLRRTKEEYPDLPYFLFGHSMGSFLTSTILICYPEAGLRGAVICGTGWQPAPVLAAGRAVCAVAKLFVGAKGHSKLLTSLMFGAYNNQFKPVRTPNDWICSDPEVVDRYTADPLCGGDATVGLSNDMLKGIAMIQKKRNLERMDQTMPIFLIAGKNDPVGAMGEGVKKTRKAFADAGMKDVTLQLYEGRHEILNEKNHDEVYADVWHFIEKQL